MFHPLSPDLTKLTSEELTSKYSELINQISISYRMGNADMVYQLQLLLQDYQTEMNQRNRKALEEMEKSSKNFKNIIDIQ